MKNRFSLLLPLVLIIVLLSAFPVFAYFYRSPLAISENSTAAHSMMGVIAPSNNQWMVDNGFILQASANDTRVETLGGSVKPHMVTDNMTLTAIPVPLGSQTNLFFTTGNSELASTDIITGYGGFITTPDINLLELGDNWTYEAGGAYLATADNETLLEKENTVKIWNSGNGNITAAIAGGNWSVIEDLTGGFHASDITTHSVNITDNITAGDLLVTLFSVDGDPTITFPPGWTFLADNGTGSNRLAVYYRFATGTEGNIINVTTNATEMSAYQTYRIAGMSLEFPTPEITISAGNSANPNPPALSPSWGAKNTLWLAICGYNNSPAVNGYPANYSDGRADRADVAGGCGVASARRNNNTATEDPGTYTLANAQAYVGATIGIALPTSVTATGLTAGSYSVNVTAIQNESRWATGYTVNFTEVDVNSYIDCGVIYDASAKLWVDFWFRLDNPHTAGSGSFTLWAKQIGVGDYIRIFLSNGGGQLYFEKRTGGVIDFQIPSVETSWNADQWYHVLASTSSVNAVRFIIDGGVALTNANVSAIPNGGNFVIGDRTVGGAVGIGGEIMNFIVGTDDLSVAEETALYNGIAPGDETDYWYLDEGKGTIAYSEGSAGNDGAIGSAVDWITSTYSSGQTGRLSDFTIGIDDDRWGSNQKYGVVADSDHDYTSLAGVPYADNESITINGTQQLWYQPNSMIIGDNMPDRAGTNNGTITWGANPLGVSALLGSMVSTSTSFISTGTTTPPRDVLPETEVSDWFGDGTVTKATTLANPIRSLVTMVSDNTTFSEIQVWRLYGLILLLGITVWVATMVGHHQGITMIVAGAIFGGLVAFDNNIFPLYLLVLTIGLLIGGIVAERSPSV